MTAERHRTAARRRVARRHHPDLGGDPDEFVRAMARVDEQFAAAGDSGPSRRWYVAKRYRYAVRRGLRSAARRVRASLPRSAPGSRRYHDL